MTGAGDAAAAPSGGAHLTGAQLGDLLDGAPGDTDHGAERAAAEAHLA